MERSQATYIRAVRRIRGPSWSSAIRSGLRSWIGLALISISDRSGTDLKFFDVISSFQFCLIV